MNYEGNHYLLNAMCDIIQFVVIDPSARCTSTIIAQNFIQGVLIKFGIYHLVVIDNSTSFKSVLTII